MVTFPPDRPIDCICVGRVNVDLYAHDQEKDLQKVQHFEKSIGGSPANIAVGLAKLGAKTALLSAIGKDAFGMYVLSFLEKKSVETHLIKIDPSKKTSICFAEVKAEDSEVLFYRDQAADKFLTKDDYDEKIISSAKCLMISGNCMAHPGSREMIQDLVNFAKNKDLIIVVDLDVRLGEWKEKDKIPKHLGLLAEQADILVGTEEELSFISNHIHLPELYIQKKGKEGSIAITKDGKQIKSPIFPIKTLKNYGAGDAFLASCLSGLLKQLPLEKSLELGSAAAALVVSRRGCAMAMPTMAEIENLILSSKK